MRLNDLHSNTGNDITIQKAKIHNTVLKLDCRIIWLDNEQCSTVRECMNTKDSYFQMIN